MYTSTRKDINLKSKKCIELGISPDGGLFIMNKFNDYQMNEEDANLSYDKLAKKIFSYYFDDFSEEEIDDVINKGYKSNNFKDELYHLESFDDFSFLELYHGPTFAFKDMALTILPHLLGKAKSDGKKTLILTATSGDTGGAALSGFYNMDQSSLIVLYPTDGVSSFQEKQMQYFRNSHQYVISVEGNFDDCQTLVKKIFSENINLNNYSLSSANSINIGRLVPQIVYYFKSYYDLVKASKIKYGEKINFVVPTGNFGDIFAGYLAKEMGLYIDKLVCASNDNNVLTDFFESGIYDAKRKFIVTDSPAMDILISSNLERLIYLISNNDSALTKVLMDELKKNGKYEINAEMKKKLNSFLAYYINNVETINLIKDCFNDHHYLIDPHTAVAYGCYKKAKKELKGETVILSTASPYKFLDAMRKAFDLEGEDKKIISILEEMTGKKVPALYKEILNYDFDKITWNKDNMYQNLIHLIGEIDEKN